LPFQTTSESKKDFQSDRGQVDCASMSPLVNNALLSNTLRFHNFGVSPP